MSALCFHNPLTTTSSTPHRSHMATAYSAWPCQDSLLLLQGALQPPGWENFLAQACFWSDGPYLLPKFSCQDFEQFSQFFPDFPEPCAQGASKSVTLHSRFVLGCSPDPWIFPFNFHLLTGTRVFLIYWFTTDTPFPDLGRAPQARQTLGACHILTTPTLANI